MWDLLSPTLLMIQLSRPHTLHKRVSTEFNMLKPQFYISLTLLQPCWGYHLNHIYFLTLANFQFA